MLLAIGVGGYAVRDNCYIAVRKGKKTLIQEQNSYAGITNKILAKRVDKICVALKIWKDTFQRKRSLSLGNPYVRKSVIDQG